MDANSLMINARRQINADPINITRTLQTTMAEGQQLEDLLVQQQKMIIEKETVYTAFTGGLSQLAPEIPIAGQQAAPQDDLSTKERKKRHKKLKKEMKRTPRLITAAEVQQLPLMATKEGRKSWASSKTSKTKLTQLETLQQVKAGNYSNFENFDPVMRNMTATKALYDLVKRYQLRGNEDPEALCEAIQQEGAGVSALLNPTLRLGLSLAQQDSESNIFTPAQRELFLKLDEAMSTAVMTATLTHVPELEKVKRDIRDKNPKMNEAKILEASNKAIEANQAQQIQIAKRLLLMQLSRFDKVNTPPQQPPTEAWDKSMAVALSHCSRIVLTLPIQQRTLPGRRVEDNKNSAEMHTAMWQSIFTTGGGNPAEDNPRGSSTHSIERRAVGTAATKEKKVKFNFRGQRGMNCAIGGLGNEGIGGRLLSNDGSCGHFYSMYKEADTEHYGAMLMGLESDCYGVTNQLGHTHDLLATGEHASSLGAQRTDEVGAKYGGRQCDLSSLTAQEISEWMNRLERKIRNLQSSTDPEGREMMEDIMKSLSGKKLNGDELGTLWWKLDLRGPR